MAQERADNTPWAQTRTILAKGIIMQALPNPTPEEWRPVTGYPYEVSDLGRVRSLHTGETMSPWVNAVNGYPSVDLYRNGERAKRTVHSLVAEAFLGPKSDPRWEVRHLDGNASDSRAANLAWGSSSRNSLDTVEHGTHVQARKTHCKRGHAFTPENTRVKPTPVGVQRVCRTCQRDRARKAADAAASVH